MSTDPYVAQYEAGATYAEVAESMGVCRKTATRHLKALGVTTRERGAVGRPFAVVGQEWDDVVDLYANQGVPICEIAEAYGSTNKTISARLRARGVAITQHLGPRQSPEAIEMMVAAFLGGETFRDIAKAHGVSEMTVAARIKEHGYTVADRGTGVER